MDPTISRSRPATPDAAGLAASLAEDQEGRLHFVGVAGAGMSALAQYRVLGGGRTSGSDRAFDQGTLIPERQQLERLGVGLHPQDGSAIPAASGVVTSTAVEAAIPDLAAARDLGLPVIHRAELLGHYVRTRPSAAIAGTSGKSTVTAMLFEILAHAGRDPGLVAGGDLRCLAARGFRGNAWRGSGPLVVEADESDGSLIHHAPEIGVVLNLHRDHMEPEEALRLFDGFVTRTRGVALVSDDSRLAPLRGRARVFGFGPAAALRGERLELGRRQSRFRFAGVPVDVPLPGEHNAANALAALAAAATMGVGPEAAAAALRRYQGVARRFEIVGTARGVTVVDDYAHNPAKVGATLRAAQADARRVLVFFQPHGFGPTRFMRSELVDVLASTLRPLDRFWLGEIFYAGGTVTRDLSSADLVNDLRQRGVAACFLPDRNLLGAEVAVLAEPGDLLLVLGGRDPTLAAFARGLLSSLAGDEIPSDPQAGEAAAP